ncbi:PAS domain S-box protein [Pseudoroseomonas cervicalis]|uniref:PAS domain S-box protein n=1 Tax=Teichococcus cervicalis TaxID=204525 RepID=UPI0027868B97|nr:PAS domain S-box protein [Pseudoroseomonas cervicalis]MDQ1081385.1 PAS domain S-box-containing protein [Pseudoroseomonas cervicalis]
MMEPRRQDGIGEQASPFPGGNPWGEGEMAERMLGHDWSCCPLGAPAAWPQSLRTTVGLMLPAQAQIVLFWGEDCIAFYNDAYAPTIGHKHPHALGRPAREYWSELWDDLGPLLEQVRRTGRTLHAQDRPFYIERHGYPETVYFDISYSAVPDERGGVGGVLCIVSETTQRVEGERRLRQSEARLRGVLEGMGEAFLLFDAELRLRDANGAVLRLLDRPREALLGLSPGEIWPEPAPGAAGEAAEAAEAEAGAGLLRFCRGALALPRHGVAEPYSAEQPFPRTGGGTLWLELRAYPTAEGLAVFCRDITERRRASEQLREERRMLETLNRTGAALSAELEPERLVQMVTDAGLELSGASFGAFFYRDETQPATAAAAYPLYALSGAPRAAFAHFAAPRETALLGPTFRGEAGLRCDDVLTDPRFTGQPPGHLPVRSYLAVPVVSRDGAPLGGLLFGHPEPGRFTPRHERMLVGLAGQAAVALDNARLYQAAQRELAVRRQAQEALRASEERFRVIADSVDQMIWSTRPDGHHDYFNQRWYDYTGTPQGSTDGDGWAGIFHPEDQPRARALWAHCLASGERYHIEYRLRHHSGEYRWVIGRALPLRGADGAIRRWYGTCTDIHDLKQAEAALRDLTATLEQRVASEVAERVRAEAALRQVQKMEAVGQLSGGLAHDFNNLLTGIMGSLELLQLRLAQGRAGDTERYINAAHGAARRAASLTQRLLAFARRQTLDPRPTDVTRLVAGMEELIRRTVGPAVEIAVQADARAWPVLVDANQLENALLNLCINARDAMPEGGRIRIETANAVLEAAEARGIDLAPGRYLVLSVTDTGTGMTPEVAARAFDPFFTTKPLGEGTGLGLSMIYGFVRQSGGQVRLRTAPGQGSTFHLYLPRHDGGVEEPEPPPARDPAQAGEARMVLVVDDEPAVRMLMVDVLQGLGHATVEAADGAAALRLLQSGLLLDLMVTDVGLPGGMNGRQLAEAARSQRPDMPVLFVTGYAEHTVIGNGPLEPGMQLLTKPFAMESLAEKAQAMLGLARGAG